MWRVVRRRKRRRCRCCRLGSYGEVAIDWCGIMAWVDKDCEGDI
jgi:hypothetical protein